MTTPATNLSYDVPQWALDVETAWTKSYTAMATEWAAPLVEGLPHLIVSTDRPLRLPCGLIRPDSALLITVQSNGPHLVTIEALAKGARLSLTRDEVQRWDESTPGLHLSDSVLGDVHLVAGDARPLPVTFDEDFSGRFVAEGGSVAIDEADTSHHEDTVWLRRGTLIVDGYITDLTLAGEAALVSDRRATVGNLQVQGKSRLLLDKYRDVSLSRIVGLGEGAECLLSFDNRQEEISFLRVSRVALKGEPGVRVTIQDRLEDVALAGPTRYEIGVGALGDNVEFRGHGDQAPNLLVRDGVVMAGLSGDCVLASASHAHLAGAPEGFRILKIRTDSSGKALTEGVVLTNFRLPSELEGRKLLARLQDAYHLDPHTGDLPGWGRWRYWKLPWKRRSLSEMRRLRHDKEFMRELARLVSEKGAPGSTRTKVAWCAYRLRHLTTESKVEKAALWVYRLLGYGERPMPSFVLWAVLSVIAAAIALGGGLDLSLGGASRLEAETLRQASGPIAALMKSGTASLDQEWEYVLRALVAAPLITGALALRNYVKSAKD